MGNIVLLDDLTINQIAAGEVIERPANVVKELVENSIDAGANKITIEIKNGGKTFIKVVDNGKGMEQDDMFLSLERHATSKIKNIEEKFKANKSRRTIMNITLIIMIFCHIFFFIFINISIPALVIK